MLVRLRDVEDRASWQEFYERYSSLIYGRARNASLTHSEAEEVLQDAVIAVAKRMPGFRYDPAVCAFKTWLFQIVSRRIADQFRKRRRADRLLEPFPENAEDLPVESATDPKSIEPDPAWEREWEEHLLKAALDRLRHRVKAKHFQIYNYHVMQDHTAMDTARHLQTNVATVYIVKHRLTKQLAEEVRRLREWTL